MALSRTSILTSSLAVVTAGALGGYWLTAASGKTVPAPEMVQSGVLIPTAGGTENEPATPASEPAAPGATPAAKDGPDAVPEPAPAEPTGKDRSARARVLGTEVTLHDAPSELRIDAPNTRLKVDKDRGKVWLRAPNTDVKVDPDRRRVSVRSPYGDFDLRW